MRLALLRVKAKAMSTHPRQTRARGGQTAIASELWLTNTSGVLRENITPIGLKGKVTWNVHSAIKSALAMTTLEPGPVVPYTSVVAPILKLTDLEGNEQRHQLGLYITVPPKLAHTKTHSTGTIEGRGLEWLLANDYYNAGATVAAGANIIAAAVGIIAAKGLRHSIPASSLTMPTTRVWPADASKLTIVNDLLNSAGYYTVYSDRYGVLRSRPYFTLAHASPALELYSGEGGIVIDDIEQEGVYETVANKIIVLKENPSGAPLRVTRTNSDPASPTSTISLGRVITRVIKDAQIADINVAKALAARALEEASSFTNKLKVTTMPVPDRDLHEVYDLAIYNDEGVAIAFGRWWCDAWEIGLTLDSAKMVHHIKRLEAYGVDEVVA